LLRSKRSQLGKGRLADDDTVDDLHAEVSVSCVRFSDAADGQTRVHRTGGSGHGFGFRRALK
jgi:hypothetical protein